MHSRKVVKVVIYLIITVILSYGIHYAWVSFPLISGYAAKNVCSCVFAAGQLEDEIKKEELGRFPKSMAAVSADYEDSTVTSRVWGLAKRKAIFRPGLGCTLINDITEKDLRSQSFSLPVPVQLNQDTVDWPMGDRISLQLPEGIDEANLAKAVNFAFDENDPDHKTYTRAVLIVYKGVLVNESYAPGFDKHSIMIGWSMAKSFMSALIGVLVQEGKLQTDMKAPVKEWSDPADKRNSITLENLLQQTSGLDFEENYTKFSSVTDMLFNKGNMAAYTASLPLAHEPGTHFNYSSGNSNIISRIIRQAIGDKGYYSFPYNSLFYKLGMYSALLEPDASGTFVGSSYIYATARDYARFGLLYANDGIWRGERILPENWVEKTMTPSAASANKNYGYQFWLNGFNKKDKNERELPDVPADMFYADGYGGQDIYIIPSKQLVVVRLGVNPINENEFLKRVVSSVK